ncbi:MULTISPECIES: LON peptidase substrate-binding domain-containing protein [unclassified Colwellia]|uniref:LON peptidase substrate-binding domain-containing protein n=1 Tax=unclassified Colwellia TaxID=196834 RepID=UPI0015F57591|nr:MULTISPECIES: LON peptidase substrate-binding domain-containing protein [unclassified Colwellia]MBA6346630.1 LON peptidase substrate-binding domain-containing protein [Colwellia sp. BRX8-9]MBA6353691.1 LON peptidase substrate-binding domain-containing protein [Colwellia sp. BRX9-1]|tara:strand:- start:1591 stop:2160 length:570 start_codon:yes stop_codon:yes gene_type:complete
MKITTINLPVFPLPIFLLPEGVTKLRIFEPRYLKMVGIASKNGGFIIWSKNSNNDISNSLWGSWVEIINFDQGDDGILEIDVKCKSLVEINTLTLDSDKLYFGDVKQIQHWSQSSVDTSLSELSESLANVFTNNPDLDDLYQQKEITRPSWVIARWLELLPIDLDIKATFVINHDFQAAKELVQSVIDK